MQPLFQNFLLLLFAKWKNDMLSKNRIKYIRSLEMKKYRDELSVFVAEGNKLVADLLPAFACEWLLARPVS